MGETPHGWWRWASALVPPAAWLGVIALWSGDVGSHGHVTHWVITRLAHWFPGWLATSSSRETLSSALWDLRKPAHLLEYAVLALLAYRAATMLFGWSARRRVVVAVALCGLVGALDELHQSLNPARNALPTDALVDIVGGVGGLAVAGLVRRWREGHRRQRPEQGPNCPQEGP